LEVNPGFRKRVPFSSSVGERKIMNHFVVKPGNARRVSGRFLVSNRVVRTEPDAESGDVFQISFHFM
jgi:hypothetical protein